MKVCPREMCSPSDRLPSKDKGGYQRDTDSSPNLSELSSSSVTLFFHWSKAKGNGNGVCLARVSWYERQILIGPNHFFDRLFMARRESFMRGWLMSPYHVDNHPCPYQSVKNLLKDNIGRCNISMFFSRLCILSIIFSNISIIYFIYF